MALSETLYGKTPEQLAAVCAELGMPRFAAKQLARWLYAKHVEDPMRMSDIAAAHRAKLAERFRPAFTPPARITESADGTKKYLYRTQQGAWIESAYIPDGERATLCVSSQAGCRMGCKFCATGRQGLQHSLTTAEILNQIVSLPERDSLTNVVFMGMGEPLDNTDNVLRALEIMTSEWGFGWSPTRITLSTAGVAPELQRFLDATKVHLAVSLHNPFHEERAAIMPVERAWPIAEVAAIPLRLVVPALPDDGTRSLLAQGRRRLHAAAFRRGQIRHRQTHGQGADEALRQRSHSALSGLRHAGRAAGTHTRRIGSEGVHGERPEDHRRLEAQVTAAGPEHDVEPGFDIGPGHSVRRGFGFLAMKKTYP